MSTESKKVEEQEQIPLKSDTDTDAAAAPPPTEPAPEEPKPKRNWFTWGKKKSDGVEETLEATLEEGGEPSEKASKKGCPWWKKRCGNKGESEQKEENISIGIDLVNRDEKSINSHIQFAFDDIFGEPDSQHSWDCVWRLNYKVFVWTRQFVYRLLSLLALPFTIIFAILFGLVACLNVFIVVPVAKLASIPANCLAKVWNWLVHAVFDPLSSAIGLVFSSFTIRKYGINQETTAPCV